MWRGGGADTNYVKHGFLVSIWAAIFLLLAAMCVYFKGAEKVVMLKLYIVYKLYV